MKTTFLLFVPIAIVFLVIPSSLRCEEEIEPAVNSAKEWLTLIDEGKYMEGWEAGADYLKGAVTGEQLVSSLKGARKPLGKVVSRELKSSEYMTELPGAPDGEYVVIQFETSFENKKLAIETITPMKEKDGSWKIAGYQIK